MQQGKASWKDFHANAAKFVDPPMIRKSRENLGLWQKLYLTSNYIYIIYSISPLVILNIAIENGPVEIVDDYPLIAWVDFPVRKT